ncbi:MAG: fasciclin domain-containing protein [Croceibacterium sp.]
MRQPVVRRGGGLAIAGAVILALAGCSGNDASDSPAAADAVSKDTLGKLVAGDDNLSVVASAMNDAGLTQVFDGAAAYTLFAPTNAAFDKLGETGTQLRTPEQRAAMVAVLRDHIVPGYLTTADIENAVKESDGGKVEMKTMGDHTLTFSGEGDALTIKSQDGATAHFAGDSLRGSNGVAVPIDGVLKAAATPAA